jgi:hypothetical protein
MDLQRMTYVRDQPRHRAGLRRMRAPSEGRAIDVIVTLGEEPTLSITDVHPIVLPDAVRLAVDATAQLAERLQATSDTA